MDHFQLQRLAEIAIEAALSAGHYISENNDSEHRVSHKDAGSSIASQVVTEVDTHCDQLIRETLRPSCERWDIALLSEETPDHKERLEKQHFWCVDPLDGTLAFINRREGYSVSIALVSHAGEATIGVIYDPAEKTLTHAIKGQGVYRNRAPAVLLRPHTEAATGIKTDAPQETLKVFADASFRKHPEHHEIHQALQQLAHQRQLAGVQYHYGMGAVKNALGVLESPAACYLKLPKPTEGGGSLWDFSASACVVTEAGGWVSNCYGNPLELNRADSTFMNHQGVIYASAPAIAQELIELCARFAT